ncbi:hypothetical protein [Nodosilinea sp. LEGE 07088]|uniref:hypothetical protein n=1 Tax=Nodosilinea sp. LEGE 07088 TaxID=2777968 RepID=UPI001D13AA8A|nr:hypothetical protein [Nodosilinea sp. LEGE 07088]
MRWVSLSAFVYFVLPSRLPDWRLTLAERLLLWLPLVLGWLAHIIFSKNSATDGVEPRDIGDK